MSDDIRMFRPYVTASARARVDRVLASGWIGQGPEVKRFEEQFESTLRVPNAVALNSATSALHLALVCAGVGPGDEVITSAQTFLATALVVLQCGAVPVFADIQYSTGNLEPADVERRVTKRTKAIVPVHWGGYPCDMDELAAIAKRHGLTIVEDAAHAIGATYRGRPIGSLSRFTCFSFQAIKHLTTGDGGMITAPERTDYDQATRRRWFGIDRDRRVPTILGEHAWDVTEIGYKYHMNDVAAAMGIEHLGQLSAMIEQRRRFAAIYRSGLAGMDGITLFDAADDRESAFWVYDFHVDRREDAIRALKGRGIEASVLHQRIDRNSVFGGVRSDLPVLARFDETHLCLPAHNGLDTGDIERVVAAVQAGW